MPELYCGFFDADFDVLDVCVDNSFADLAAAVGERPVPALVVRPRGNSGAEDFRETLCASKLGSEQEKAFGKLKFLLFDHNQTNSTSSSSGDVTVTASDAEHESSEVLELDRSERGRDRRARWTTAESAKFASRSSVLTACMCWRKFSSLFSCLSLASLDLMSRGDALDIELSVSASEEHGLILPSLADSEARVSSCVCRGALILL